MSNLEALLLGIVQGISEFLPISSSGHLVLVRYHLGWGTSLPLYVGIATNTGTLLAVLI
ncbi:MAG: undecaprenyl-diphosphate phosphatase, partial [Deinococcota bacterium]